MGKGVFGGISDAWGKVWDQLSGQDQARKQREVLDQAANAEKYSTEEYMKYLREALGIETNFNNRALSALESDNARSRDLEQKALDVQGQGMDQVTRLAKLAAAGDLTTQQMNLDQAIQMMKMNQSEGRSTNMARQNAIQQAFPALMAMFGLNPQSVGNGYTEANPDALSRNLLSELAGNTAGVNALLDGQAGVGAGAEGQAGGIGGQAAGQVGTSNSSPWSNVNVDVNKLLSMNPSAQFRMKQSEDAIKRSLAARGGLNGSEYTAQMGTNAGNIASQEAENLKKSLWDLVNFGSGGSAGGGGGGGTNYTAPTTNLSGFGGDVSNTLNSAAKDRANLYSSFATRQSGIPNALSSMGKAQAEGMGDIATAGNNGSARVNQARYQSGMTQGRGMIDTLGSLFDLGTKAYGTYTGMGGTYKPFGKNGLFG